MKHKEKGIRQCTGCGKVYDIGTNCPCGYASIADDAISVKDIPVLNCMDYCMTSSDGKVRGWVCNTTGHKHQGKIVVITGVIKNE